MRKEPIYFASLFGRFNSQCRSFGARSERPLSDGKSHRYLARNDQVTAHYLRLYQYLPVFQPLVRVFTNIPRRPLFRVRLYRNRTILIHTLEGRLYLELWKLMQNTALTYVLCTFTCHLTIALYMTNLSRRLCILTFKNFVLSIITNQQTSSIVYCNVFTTVHAF